jgi:hypothetical protein
MARDREILSADDLEQYHLSRESAMDSAFSVLMDRQDARTVSVTRVDATNNRVRMAYRPRTGEEVDPLALTAELAFRPRET